MKVAGAAAICVSIAMSQITGVRADAPAVLEPSGAGARADSAFQAKDWTTAAALYQQLAGEQPAGFIIWLRLGISLHKLGRNQNSLEALEKAKKAGAPASSVEYQVAIVRASTGERAKALDALADAVEHGRGRADLMLAEAEFQGLQGDPRFAQLVAAASKNDLPCRSRSENRQFDFWLGDWTVATTQEQSTVGLSHIESAIGDCAIWENWTSLGDSGYMGKSYNVYNAEQQRWEQFWVDNQAGMIHFIGNLSAGVMDFRTAAIPQPDGKPLQRRLRFFSLPTGQVRQLSEGSTDDGRTWSVEYDFTYTRVSAARAVSERPDPSARRPCRP